MKNATRLATHATALTLLLGLATPLQASPTSQQDELLATADALVAALDDVDAIASSLATKAENRGRYGEAKAFSDLALSAAAVAGKVERNVVQAILGGQSTSYLKAQLARLSSSFNLLKQDAEAVHYLPYHLEDALYAVAYLKYDLADAIAAAQRSRPGRTGRQQQGGAIVDRGT